MPPSIRREAPFSVAFLERHAALRQIHVAGSQLQDAADQVDDHDQGQRRLLPRRRLRHVRQIADADVGAESSERPALVGRSR